MSPLRSGEIRLQTGGRGAARRCGTPGGPGDGGGSAPSLPRPAVRAVLQSGQRLREAVQEHGGGPVSPAGGLLFLHYPGCRGRLHTARRRSASDRHRQLWPCPRRRRPRRGQGRRPCLRLGRKGNQNALLPGEPIPPIYIGGNPPELCPVCKVPAWKFEKIEGRAKG